MATEAEQRLLEAWRGEIQANKVYQALAAREKDPRRADILRRMGEAEVTHRARLEQRMRELGIAIPDPKTVPVGFLRSLQLRVAPTERILQAQEAAENDEVTVRYLKPTGDPETDALLQDIRVEERGHRDTIRTFEKVDHEPPHTGGEHDISSRLQRIVGRERWHQTGGGWISGAIYGANDGLAAVFGIVAGVSGATGAAGNLVLTAGLAGALASALSMATGAYLAERSEAEVAHANLQREREEIVDRPDEEKEELSLYYQLKGLNQEEADELVDKLSKNPETFLKLLAAEELGGAEEGAGHPVQAATAAGISTFLGAMVPVLPFFWLHGFTGVVVAFVVSLIAHFLVGASKALFTLRTWYAAGFEMTLAGVIVGLATYLAGSLFKVG